MVHFEIIGRIGTVTYELALPSQLASAHQVFHISLLRKYVSNLSHVLAPQTIEVRSNLSYDEAPDWIIDHQVKRLENKDIALMKVI